MRVSDCEGEPFVPLPATSVELPPQLTRDGLQMHEVTEATASAFPVGWSIEESNLAPGDQGRTVVLSPCILWRNSGLLCGDLSIHSNKVVVQGLRLVPVPGWFNLQTSHWQSWLYKPLYVPLYTTLCCTN